MSLIFRTIQTEGIAELSYLLGDDDEGVGAIFDPRADVEIYVEMAREAGLAITHIFETHIHADLVSGSRELCARLESAKIYSSGEGGAEYGFGPEKIKDGDRFTFGEVLVTARHTPGIRRSTCLICWPKQTIRTSRGRCLPGIRFSFHQLVARTC
jgi:hydroxyacylglutathione hydrolase